MAVCWGMLLDTGLVGKMGLQLADSLADSWASVMVVRRDLHSVVPLVPRTAKWWVAGMAGKMVVMMADSLARSSVLVTVARKDLQSAAL